MPLGEHGPPGDQVFHLRWYSRWMGSLFAFYSVMFLLMVAVPPPLVQVTGVVGLVVFVALAVRGFRCATVLLRPVGVTIRGLFRTRTISWERIVEVRSGRGSSGLAVRWIVPVLKLDDGKVIRFQEMRARRLEGSVVETVLDAIQERIEGPPGESHMTAP